MAISCSQLSPQGLLSHQGLDLEFLIGTRPLHAGSICIALVLQWFNWSSKLRWSVAQPTSTDSKLIMKFSSTNFAFDGQELTVRIGWKGGKFVERNHLWTNQEPMQTSIFYCLSNTSQVAFYDWSMAINYLKVLTDVTTTSKSPHVLDTSTKFSGFVRNVCCGT